jgi:Tol biopolymer transport system component
MACSLPAPDANAREQIDRGAFAETRAEKLMFLAWDTWTTSKIVVIDERPRVAADRTVAHAKDASMIAGVGVYPTMNRAGTEVAFAEGTHDTGRLVIRNFASRLGDVVEEWTAPGGVDAGMPAFSADGRKLAYVGRAGANDLDVFVIDLHHERHRGGPHAELDRTTAPPRVRYTPSPVHLSARVSDEGGEARFPTFSPDGGSVVFSRMKPNPGPCDAEIVRADVETGRIEVLVGKDACAMGSALAPDGRTLAFMRFGGSDPNPDHADLWLLDLATHAMHVIAPGVDVEAPIFAPDGALMFSNNILPGRTGTTELDVIDAVELRAGTNARRVLVPGPGLFFRPSIAR